MKKALSILMSILIVLSLSLFAFGAEAGVCDCKDHTNSEKGCHCCINCNNLDTYYLTSCASDGKGNIESPLVLCCNECTGIRPCSCGCDCCIVDDTAGTEYEGNGQIFTEDQQEEIVNTFQKVLGRLREFFDELFNRIFEFLRFDDVMGNN